MEVIEEVVHRKYVPCDACGTKHDVDPDGKPLVGWYMEVTRIFPERQKNHMMLPSESGTATAFLCDKECAMAYLQFQVGTVLTQDRHER